MHQLKLPVHPQTKHLPSAILRRFNIKICFSLSCHLHPICVTAAPSLPAGFFFLHEQKLFAAF